MKTPESADDLTDAQVRALRILWTFGPMTPRKFAKAMWPESDGWSRTHKCGPNGSARGAMMPKVGGGYLGKLRQADLVHSFWRNEYTHVHELSEQGRDLLIDLEGGAPEPSEWPTIKRPNRAVKEAQCKER